MKTCNKIRDIPSSSGMVHLQAAGNLLCFFTRSRVNICCNTRLSPSAKRQPQGRGCPVWGSGDHSFHVRQPHLSRWAEQDIIVGAKGWRSHQTERPDLAVRHVETMGPTLQGLLKCPKLLNLFKDTNNYQQFDAYAMFISIWFRLMEFTVIS